MRPVAPPSAPADPTVELGATRALKWRRLQAAVVSASFALLLVGTNAVNPLLPLYREVLGFDALLLSLTYVCYVGALTAFFVIMAKPALARYAPQLVIGALLLAATSDALMWTETTTGVLVGRAVSGIAGGIGTGAASALVVIAIGNRGRAITATGNLVGAVIGAAAAQLAVLALGADALRTVFVTHGAACLLMATIAVVPLLLRRAGNQTALRNVPVADPSTARVKGAWIAFSGGSVAWIALSLSVVLVPSLLSDLHMTVAASASVVLILGASALVQLLAAPLARIAPWLSGQDLLATGLTLTTVALVSSVEWCAITGIALSGAGIGIAYRTSLVHLTRGANPARQSALASRYGAVTYGAAAAATLASGVIANLLGLLPLVLGLMILLALGATALCFTAPRIGTERSLQSARDRRSGARLGPVDTEPVTTNVV